MCLALMLFLRIFVLPRHKPIENEADYCMHGRMADGKVVRDMCHLYFLQIEKQHLFFFNLDFNILNTWYCGHLLYICSLLFCEPLLLAE